MDRRREKVLLRRLRRHDEAAFNELVRRNQDRVYNLCHRMLGNSAEAEDIAQEVFCSAFRSIREFRGESKLSTWLYRIALNHCKNRLKYLGRRRYRETRPFDEVPESQLREASGASRPGEPDRRLETVQLERLVAEEVAALEEEQRALLVFRDVQELSYAEIMAITGLPEGTVKSRLHRARLSLKERLGRRLRRSDDHRS